MMKRNQTVNELMLIDGSLRTVFLLIPKCCSQRRAAMYRDPPYFIQTTHIDFCFCGHYSEARVPLTSQPLRVRECYSGVIRENFFNFSPFFDSESRMSWKDGSNWPKVKVTVVD